MLIADETGFEKTGSCSAGVQRQYTGTAGKITNCQVGVFLAYAVPAKGTRVLVDRALYIPRSWTGDRDRCAAAAIPASTGFATKPQLAQKMIERAIAGGLPFSWFTADEAYGANGPLRDWLETSKIAYVVAVACDHRVPRVLPGRQERDRPRSLPGPQAHGVVPARHPGHVRARLARRHRRC